MAVSTVPRLQNHLRGKTEIECLPVAVPHAEAEDLVASDAWVGKLHVNNTTAGALTFTLKDKQDTPVVLINKSIAANDILSIDLGGVYFPGGVTWLASGAGLRGYIKFWI